MAILAAIAIPNLKPRQPSIDKFLSDLNAFSQIAWQDTIVTGALHRVVFNFSTKRISLEKEKAFATGKQLDESQAFEPVVSAYLSNTISYSDSLAIRSFFVAGKNEMEGSEQAWYFIGQNGISQEVMINIEDQSSANREEPDVYGLVLNPFSAQFKKYETYQEPK